LFFCTRSAIGDIRQPRAHPTRSSRRFLHFPRPGLASSFEDVLILWRRVSHMLPS